MRRYAIRWTSEQRKGSGDAAAAFVPRVFRPGEAFQFDWSHEDVEIAGTPMKVKVSHVRLCASRVVYVRAYPRESQEMVFDAHARAFAFFGGVPRRGIYDNMKTAVDAVFVGKERVFDRRFLIMAEKATWSSRPPARRRRAGRRVRSRTRSTSSGDASSSPGSASPAWRS